MRHTVTGLIDKPADAQKIIDDLLAQCLCDRADIGMIAGSDPRQRGTLGKAARAASQAAVAAGSAAASALEGILGVGSDLVSRRVEGFGVLSAAGKVGSILSRAALTGMQDVAKTFIDLGMKAELPRAYAEALRQGSILIVVDAKTDNMAHCARKILAAHGAAAPDMRAGHQAAGERPSSTFR
jgi:hypothetical protein